MSELQFYWVPATAQFVGTVFDDLRRALPLAVAAQKYEPRNKIKTTREDQLEKSIEGATRTIQYWKRAHAEQSDMLGYVHKDMAQSIHDMNMSLMPTSFFSTDEKEVPVDKVRSAIVSVLWKLKNAIAFFESHEGKTSESVELLSEYTCSGTLPQRSELIDTWKQTYRAWKEVLKALDVVYMDGLFQPKDSLHYIAQSYPAAFWTHFWKHAVLTREHTPFADMLVGDIAIPLVQHDTAALRQCAAALQSLIDRGKRWHPSCTHFFTEAHKSELFIDIVAALGIHMLPAEHLRDGSEFASQQIVPRPGDVFYSN